MDTRTTLSDLFTREEITELTTPSDWYGYWAVLSTWGVIFATFTIVALTWDYLPSLGKILLYIFALIILAGRQLALAILMHDASHQSLFKTKFLNNIVTDWLCARPIWNDLHKYRKHHLRHHSKTSTQADPDLSLVSSYPTTKKSLIFKFLRDLSGMTGLKFVLGRILMDAEKMEWTVSNDRNWIPRNGRSWLNYLIAFLKNSSGAIFTNLVLFAVLWLAGHSELYLLWVLAYFTPFPLFLRIRSMAEHGGMPTSNSAITNTRTTKAGFIARALFAPIHVNFHKEHHLMAAVPYFKLPKMHQMLRERGHVAEPPSYWQVIKELSNKVN